MTRTHQLEAAIGASAGRHLAARRCPAGTAAPAARAWIETLHGHKFVQNATYAVPDNRHSKRVRPHGHTHRHTKLPRKGRRMMPRPVTPTPPQRVWGILRVSALDLLDAAIAATAGGVAGAIAFVTLGPGLLYLGYLSAATTSSLTEPGQNTQTGHFAASLSHPLNLAIMVVAFVGAVMVTWSTARAVAPYCR